MNNRVTPRSLLRPSICTTSIAAFMAAAAISPGNTYDVDLGDTLTVSTVVAGGTGLLKTGGGALVLTNAGNTYTGTTTISNGLVVISTQSALGADSSPIIVTGSDVRGFGGGSLVLNGLGGAVVISRDLSLQGLGPIADRGAALVSIGNNTLSGTVNTNVGLVSTRVIVSDGTLTISGTLDVAGVAGTDISSLGGVNQAGDNVYNLTGILTGTGTLEKSGGGALRLDPSSTAGFSGVIRVGGSAASGQSVVRITSDGVLGTRTAGGTGSVLDMNGGTLAVLMDTPSLTTGGSPANVYGRASSSYFVDHALGSALQNGNLTLGTLTFEDNNTQTFNGRNGYGFTFGAANVNGGNANSTFTNNLQGGALLTFNGNFWNNADNGAARTFTLSGNGNTQINGNINAAAAAFDHNFTKTGTGTLTITGTASTLDGNFNVNGGTVATRRIAGGLGAATSAANINIGTGGTAGTLTYLGAAGSGAGETTARTINLASTTGATRINASQTGSAATPLVITSDLTVNGGAAAKTFTLGGTAILDNEIQGAIPNGGVGGTTTVNVTKGDEGTWVLSGTNTYSGNTTITEGRLKIKANGASSTVINDASNIVFNVDTTDQSAGGTLEFVGRDGENNVETLGVLTPTQGMGRIRLTPGAGGTASLTFASLAGVSSLGASINVIAPTPLDVVTITAQPSGFVRGTVYYNGSNFAYSQAGVLRAPVYGDGLGGGGSDIGFRTDASALTDGLHNEITGNVTAGAAAIINSLKISGGQTIDMGANLLTINNGFNTVGGILVTGGNATITGTAGVTQGLGVTGNGGGALVIRVDGVSDILNLDTPITNSTVGGLTKSGLGTLVLSKQNNQNGTTEILEGTIQLAPGGRLSPANRNLTIRKVGTLDLNSISTGTSIQAFNGTGTVTNTGSAAAVLTVGNNNGTGVFSGLIQDGASQISVIKQGTGGQTWNSLTGVNTYTGSTTINSTGIVTVDLLADIGQPSSLGRGDATSDATNSASLVFGGASATGLSGGISYTGGNVSIDRLFTLGGTAANSGARILANGTNGSGIVFNKTNAIAYTAGSQNVAQHLTLGGASAGDNEVRLQLVDPAGVASARLSVRKVDASTWNISNTSNSYTGRTTINQGRLVADGLSLPATSPLVFTAVNADLLGGIFHSSGTFTRAVTATPVDGTGTVSFLNSTAPAVGTGQSGSGGFASSEGKLTVDLGSVTWDSGGFMTAGSAAATLRLNSIIGRGEVDLVSDINLNGAQRTVLVDDNTSAGGDFANLSGVLSGAGAGINKTGAGILVLSGANTYTGNTNVTAGTLVVSSLGQSGSAGATSVGDQNAGNTDAGAITIGNGSTGGAILQYVGAGETSDRKIRINATTGSAQIHADGAGPLILTNVANDMVDGNKTLFLRGTNAAGNRIESILANGSTGVLSVTVDASATWILTNGSNSYSGNTTSGAGALGIGHNAALGASTLVLSNGNVFAYGGDRTIANTVNHVNNTTQGFIGDHSLTFTAGLTSLAAANNFGTNNNIDAGKSLTFNGVTANSLTANRTWTIDGAGETIINGDFTTSSTLGVAVTKTGTGTLQLNGVASDFNKNNATLDIDNGVLRLGANEVIPHGAGFGNVVLSPEGTDNALLDLNGKTETINGLTGTGTGAKSIDNSSATAVSLTIGANDAAVNFNGDITQTGGGPLSIVKAGTGLGTLAGNVLTYTGTTSVLGGSLGFPNATPTATTGVTVSGGAELSIINGTGVGLASLTTLNLGGGAGTAALGLDLGTTSDTLTTTGSATTANTVSFAINAVSGFGAGSYDLLVSGAGGFGGATYVLAAVPGGFTYAIDTSDPNKVQLVATATAGSGTFFWTADQSTSWSTFNAGNTNWADGGGTDQGSNPGATDVVIFSSTASPPPGTTATILSTLDGNFTIDNLQFNGQVPAGFAGTGAANVTIAQGAFGSLTIAPASSLDGIDLPDNNGTATISAPVVLGADQTWTVGSTGTQRPHLAVTGVISGAGNLTKLGSGTATITGVNTRTGKTDIANGTLIINADAALGAAPGGYVANQLSIGGAGGAGILRSSTANVVIPATRGVTMGASGGTFDTTGGNITVNSPVVGGDVIKVGGNTLILNDATNSYASTNINGGAVRAGANTALGAGPVELNASGAILELADGITVSNSINVTANGNEKTLRLLAGATSGTFSGPLSIEETGAGFFRVEAAVGGTLNLNNAVSYPTGTTAPGIRKQGAGTVLLTTTGSPFQGPSSVAAGVLMHGASNVLASTTAVTVNGEAGNGVVATLDLNGFNQTVGSLTLNAAGGGVSSVNSVITGLGTLTLGGNVTVNDNGNPTTPALLSGNVALSATRTFTVDNSTGSDVDFLVSAAIGGAGGLTKSGLGTMLLTGANTYAGTTSVVQGVLRNGADDVIPGALTVNAGTTVVAPFATYDLDGFNETVSAVTMGGTSTVAGAVNSITTGTGTLTLAGNVTTVGSASQTLQAQIVGNLSLGAATRTFTVGDATAQAVDLQVSGVISGGPGAGLTKAGAGTMQLVGTHTYDGPTTVNAGTLLVSGSLTASPVTVNAPGSFGVGGSIGTGSLPSLTMTGASTFTLDINTSFLTTDHLTLTSPGNFTLDLANTVNLAIIDEGLNATLNPGDKFTFITYGGTWNGGLFNFGGPVPDEGLIVFGANTYTLDYDDGGNKVSLIVIPEPGIAVSLLGGFGMLVGLQRIRRRRAC